MLVLSRKYQEKVRIGDGITITVLRAKGKAVRLGIEAPADVPVIRGELVFHQSPMDQAEQTQERAATEPEVRRPAAQRQDHAVPAWSTQSHPRTKQGAAHNKVAPQVALRRVPRDKAVEVLPQLLADRGPLRDMLDLRSGTV